MQVSRQEMNVGSAIFLQEGMVLHLTVITSAQAMATTVEVDTQTQSTGFLTTRTPFVVLCSSIKVFTLTTQQVILIFPLQELAMEQLTWSIQMETVKTLFGRMQMTTRESSLQTEMSWDRLKVSSSVILPITSLLLTTYRRPRSNYLTGLMPESTRMSNKS